MNAAGYYSKCERGFAPVMADWFRMYDGCDPGAYLITLHIPARDHGLTGAFPQTRAVMDDFGTLKLVEQWS